MVYQLASQTVVCDASQAISYGALQRPCRVEVH